MHRADGDPLQQGPSSVLGTNEVAPLSLAVAFAGIANNGVTCTPVAIDRIVERDGNDVPMPKSTCTAAVTPDVAAAMHYAMQTRDDGRYRDGIEPRREAARAVDRQDRHDRRQQGHLDGAAPARRWRPSPAVVSVDGDANQRASRSTTGTPRRHDTACGPSSCRSRRRSTAATPSRSWVRIEGRALGRSGARHLRLRNLGAGTRRGFRGRRPDPDRATVARAMTGAGAAPVVETTGTTDRREHAAPLRR